ncbi:MAG: Mur ligase family protein [Polyangiaceae bacterium]
MSGPASPLAKPLAALYALGGGGIKLGLFGMREACERAGHPERSFDCVHIAGTNGKGSTSAFVESVARAEGLRTGMYSSPHLCRFAERIRIDGEPIDDEALAEALNEAQELAPDLSFFEVATLTAFLVFRKAKVELAVLEVGLGGRLDATNVVERPLVTAITSIGLDHMQYLGNTLEEIAGEKAGILKRGVPCVLGRLPSAAEKTIRERARVIGSPIVSHAHEAEACAAVLAPLRDLFPAYQANNLEVAWHIARALGRDEHFEVGARSMSWPGRFELIEKDGTKYLLDGAHNPEGAAALAASLDARALVPAVLVFGAMADKSWEETLRTLGPRARSRIYVQPKGRAPAPLADLERTLDGTSKESVAEALAEGTRRAGQGGLVLVAGSLYLVGEARSLLLGLPMDPPIAL